MSPQNATAWPNIQATMNADGSARLTTNGYTRVFPPAEPDKTRQAILGAVTETAQEFNRKVRLRTEGADGQWVMIIDPSGTIEAETSPPVNRRAAVEPPTETLPIPPIDHRPISQLRPSSMPTPPRYAHSASSEDADTADDSETSEELPAVPRRRAEVETVLYPEQALAEAGWRGLLARLGIRVAPSQKERAYRDDVAAVSQHWRGVRTVVIAGPKGRSNKTLTAAILAAVFARLGGAGVVAWDNNPNQGTLPWRTEKGPHTNTVVDLLQSVATLMNASAQAGDMAQFLHHQSADLYDVLASDQSVDSEYEMSWEEFDSVHDVVAKYNRMVFVDSGNSERGPYWKASVAKADQLVVTVVESKDVIEAAERLLDRLHAQKGHAEWLAQNVIVIVSQTSPSGSLDVALEKMRPRAKELVVVPYDESLKDGMIRFDALHPASQREWLRAASTVARNL